MIKMLCADDGEIEQKTLEQCYSGLETPITIVDSPDKAIQAIQGGSFTHVLCDGFDQTGWVPVIEAAKEHGIIHLMVWSADDHLSDSVLEAGAIFLDKGGDDVIKMIRAFGREEESTIRRESE
jgi:CheY-like chemotaxis protein